MLKFILFALLFISSCTASHPALATVSSTQNTVTYAGDGVTTSFAFNNNVYASTDLNVYEQVVSTGVLTTLVLNTGYTVTLTAISNNSGAYTATLNLAAGSSPAGAPAVGTNLILQRAIPYTQAISIADYSQTPAATWNQALDRSAILSQQLLNLTNRAILQSVSATSPVTLPSPVLGNYLIWGPGNTLVNTNGSGAQGPAGQGVPTGGTINQVLTKNSSTNYDDSWITPATSGTVTSVTSANGDITVANTTTTPVLTLNSGTTANKIVKLDGSAKLPAVDGSQLTNLPTASSTFVPTNIQVFTTTGTWSKPGGISKAYVKVWGAGGGGGGINSAGTAGGGGGGGYSEGFTAVTGDVTVTVGAGGTAGSSANGTGGTGGTSSFAGSTTIQATGGVGGHGDLTGVGGTGGVGSNGAINLTGASGEGGTNIATQIGSGGGTYGFSSDGYPGFASAGVTPTQYGCGGGAGNKTGSNETGGVGGGGLVIVYY